MFAKFKICSSNMQARKNYLSNHRTCNGNAITDNVHMIANFSAINDSIQKANDSFNSSHIGVLFTTHQKKGSNI